MTKSRPNSRACGKSFIKKPLQLVFAATPCVYLVLGGVLLLAGVVLALRQLRVHGVEELRVGGVAHVETRLVHHGHDAPVRLVDQVADVLQE